jgi:UDP-N-acetylmuramoyl-tripeptide--D-alanyl-D-alanine ligase
LISLISIPSAQAQALAAKALSILCLLNSFTGKKIAVLGKMAELGDKSDAYHRKIGDFAKSLDINQLYSFQSDYGVQNFNNEAELLTTLKQHTDCTILFKGSRVAKLEQIIKKLCV